MFNITKKTVASFIVAVFFLQATSPFLYAGPREKEKANAVFKQGKTLYDQGKFKEAVDVWDTLGPEILDQEPSVKKIITFLKSKIPAEAMSVSAESSPAEEESAPAPAAPAAREKAASDIKIDAVAPIEMEQSLSRARQKVEEKMQAMQNAKFEQIQDQSKKQAAAQAGFEKGQELFDQGRYAEALKTWKAILPYLQKGSDIEGKLAKLEAAVRDLETAQKQPQVPSDQKFRAPAGFEETVRQAGQQLQKRAQDEMVEKIKMQNSAVDRQKWVDQQFADAKEHFAQGRYELGFQTIEKILPHVEDASQLETFLDGMRLSYRNLQEARKTDTVPGMQTKKFQAPTGMIDMLSSVDTQLQGQAREALESRSKLEKAAMEQQMWVESAFQKGKALYAQGQYKEAVAAWGAALPYLEDETRLRTLIESVQRNADAAEQAKTLAKTTSLQKNTKFKSPTELSQMLDGLNAKLQGDILQSKSERAKAEQVVAERQQWIISTFQKGKDMYQAGRFQDALTEWDRLTPYLDENSGVRELIEKSKLSYQEMTKAQSQTASFASTEYKSLKVPYAGEMNNTLSQVLNGLDLQTKEALSQRAQMERTLSDRKTWIDQTFQKGKAFFDKGQVLEAVQTWQALTPYLEEGSQIKAYLDSVAKNYELSQNAQTQAKTVLAQKDQKFKSPDELAKLLDQAKNDLKTQAFQAQTQKAQTEQTLFERQQWINQTFQRGKELYKQQNYTEALAAWKELSPYLEDEAQIREYIQSVEASILNASESKRAVEDAKAKQNSKLKVPQELIKSLSELSQKYKLEIQDALTQRSEYEKTAAGRQTLVDQAIDKGKELYREGEYQQALDTWKTVLPYISESSQLESYIQSVQASLDNANAARKAAAATAARKDDKFKAPEELLLFLNQSGKELEGYAQLAKSETVKTESAIDDRRQWVISTFQKGKTLYEQGKVKEALDIWSQMAPYLAEEKQIAQAVQVLEKNYQASLNAKAAFQEADSKKDQKFKSPAELGVLLEQANGRFQSDIAEAQANKQKADAALEQKQAWIQTSFQKGKDLYLQGKVQEALDLWDDITPYLDPASDAQKLLNEAKAAQAKAVDAKREAVLAASNEYKGFEIPGELVTFLDDAESNLRAQIQQLTSQKTRAEKAFFDKQSWIDTTFERGRTQYTGGNIADAIDTWKKLLPYLDSQPELKKQIGELENLYASAGQSHKAASEIQAQRLQEPADLRKTLTDVGQALQQQAVEAGNARLAAENSLVERQGVLTENFLKARSLFKEGKVDEALALLESMAPSVADEAGLQGMIKNLRASQANWLQAQKAAEKAQGLQNQKLKAPENFAKSLAQMDKELETQTKAALSRRSEADQALAERSRLLELGYSKGAALLNEGKIKEALDTWNGITSYLEPGSEATIMIEQAQNQYKAMLDAQTQAQSATLRKEVKFRVSPDWLRNFAEAQARLEQQTKDSVSQRLQMEKAVADRQQWIATTFQAGQGLYQQGEIDKAVAEWKKLLPYIDPASGLPELLEKISQSRAALDKEKSQTALFASTEYKSLKVPYAGEMNATLSQVLTGLDTQTKEALSQRAQMEKTLADRKAWIDQTFQKGKAALDKGQIMEAVQAWQALTPYLEDSSQIKAYLDSVAKNYDLSQSAQSAAKTALAQKDQKFKSPEELSKLLDQAKNNLKNQTFLAETQKTQSEQALLDRQQWINQTFQKGKELYKQEKYTEALAAWKELSPYLEDEAQVREFISDVETGIRNTAKAKADAAEAAGRENMKLKTPTELSGALAEINNQLKYQIYDAQTRQAKSQKTLADRQRAVDAIFERGNLLYAQGKYYEAVSAWKDLLPYLQDEAKLLPLIEQAQKNYRIQADAKLVAEDSAQKQEAKLKTPENMGRILSEISETYAKQTEALLKERDQMNMKASEREAWVQSVFEKGKQYYDIGRYPDALREWKQLLPVIQDASQIEQYLKTIEANIENLRRAQAATQSSVVSRDTKLPVPVGLPDLLNEAAARLKSEAFEAETQKTKADQTLSERQAFLKTTFEKGKTFYGEGRFAEAIQEWEKLGPYLEEQSGVQKVIAEAKKNYESSVHSKEQAVQAFANEYKGLKLTYTDQMITLLNQANKKLIAENSANKSKVEELEKTLAERREWAANTFNRGSVYYDQGRYQEALEQWERLLPYLDEDSPMKKAIASIKQNLNAVQNQTQASDELTKSKDKWTEVPEEFSKSIQEIARKYEQKAAEAQENSKNTEKEFAERKEYIRFVYQKGKDQFDQGLDDEALKTWETLTPFLKEAPELKTLIEKAKESKRSADAAKKQSQQLEQRKRELPILPQARIVDEPAAIQPVVEDLPEEPAQPVKTEAPSAPAVDRAKTEFISGEIMEIDPDKGTMKIKLYTVGEKKNLTLNFDQKTQVKGDENAPALDSLKTGTAVDLRYDPESQHAVYIYVY